ERPRAQVVDLDPGVAVVAGLEDAARLDRPQALLLLALLRPFGGLLSCHHANVGPVRLYDGEQDLRVLPPDVDAATAHRAVGQALAQLRPLLTAVAGAVQAGLGAELLRRVAAREAVPPHGVRRGVERIGVARLHPQIDAAGVLVQRQDVLPRLAAVGRLE